MLELIFTLKNVSGAMLTFVMFLPNVPIQSLVKCLVKKVKLVDVLHIY